MIMTLLADQFASITAARRVQKPRPLSQMPSPGLSSHESKLVFTVNTTGGGGIAQAPGTRNRPIGIEKPIRRTRLAQPSKNICGFTDFPYATRGARNLQYEMRANKTTSSRRN